MNIKVIILGGLVAGAGYMAYTQFWPEGPKPMAKQRTWDDKKKIGEERFKKTFKIARGDVVEKWVYFASDWKAHSKSPGAFFSVMIPNKTKTLAHDRQIDQYLVLDLKPKHVIVCKMPDNQEQYQLYKRTKFKFGTDRIVDYMYRTGTGSPVVRPNIWSAAQTAAGTNSNIADSDEEERMWAQRK